MRCVNINKCKVVSYNKVIYEFGPEAWKSWKANRKDRVPVLIIWQLPLFTRKQTFIWLSFFKIYWLLNDCSSWNMNVFVLVVSWADLVHSLHNLVIYFSSSYWLYYSIHANLTIFKVKTSCNLYYRVKEKSKFYEITNFARNLN